MPTGGGALKVLRRSDVPSKGTEGEVREYYFFDGFDEVELIITHVPPQFRQEMHGHRLVNEIHYVIKGQIVAIEGESEVLLKEGDSVLFEKGHLHTVENLSGETSIVLTIKQPRLEDKYNG